MKKSIILYGAKTKLSLSHKRVHHSSKQPAYYVRIECVNCDIDTALSQAKPLDGEVVLNTIPIELI